jgi:DNA-binding transcriptional LysR family regulator
MPGRLEGFAELVAVADAGGFSAAARRIGVSKSLLSQRVARLEARLGARLLHRTTRRLCLTEAGRVCCEHGRRILEEAGRIEDAMQALCGEPRGRLKVATTVQFATEHLAAALPLFQAHHPRVAVDVLAQDGPTDLAGESVDVAIRFTRLDDPNMVARRLAPLRYLLCASPAYLEQRGVPRHPDELCEHSCLINGFSPSWAVWHFHENGAGSRVLGVQVNGVLRTDSCTTLGAMAIAGCGIAQLTTVDAGEALRAGRLVEVLREWPLEGLDDRSVWAVYAGNRAIPPKVRAFVDFLATYIGSPPRWEEGL